MRSQIAAILAVTSLLSACVTPAAMIATWSPQAPVQHEEKVIRGVVRGLWKYVPEENVDRFTQSSVGASAGEAAGFANRYQVRVGIGANMIGYFHIKVVPLPEGWTYSLDKVIDDGRTVNVGDIVDIRTIVGSRIIPLIAIIRKCNEAPLPGENPDWRLDCQSYDSFESSGYAGELNVWTGW